MFKIQKKAGFSLSELLVTTTIIAVLATMSVPSYFRYKQKSELTAIHTVVLGAVKDFNICMTDNGEDVNPCITSMQNQLDGTKVNGSSLTLNTGALTDNRYVVTGSVDNSDYPSVCVHINDEGKVSTLSYGGTNKLCYKNNAPTVPMTACTANSDCPSGATCATKNGTYTRANGCA